MLPLAHWLMRVVESDLADLQTNQRAIPTFQNVQTQRFFEARAAEIFEVSAHNFNEIALIF